MNAIVDRIAGLQVGESQAYQNLAIFPLSGGNSSALEYLVLDEAMQRGLVLEDTGNVPSLRVRNDTGKLVLMLQGEYVLGGKQNRMVAQSVLLPVGYDGELNVYCVEAGRWDAGRGRFATSRSRVPTSIRRATLHGQQKVWEEVKTLQSETGTISGTHDLDDSYRHKKNEVQEYQQHFSLIPGTVGIVAVTRKNGRSHFAADIFDQESSLQLNFPKLVESHIMEVLVGEEARVPGAEVKAFLGDIGRVGTMVTSREKGGQEARLQGRTTEGVALIYENVPVYISAYTKA